MHRATLSHWRLLFAAGLLAALSSSALAESISKRLQDLFGNGPGGGIQEYLDAEAAFKFSARVTGPNGIALNWDIAEGYYLYRDKFVVAVADGAARLGPGGVEIPPGEIKEDEVFGRVKVNTGQVPVSIALVRKPGPELPVTLSVGYQGCKDGAICYPPISRRVALVLPARSAGADTLTAETSASGTVRSADETILQRLREASVLGNLLAFFVFGLLLSLTPCVFPMIPILSGILLGPGGRSTPRGGLSLSCAYVLAMALSYAALGVIAGSFRVNLQVAAQTPWVITLFSAVFVLLALSMFGLFQMQMPPAIQAKLSALSERQRAGTLRGAAVMGMLSALIVGPCVAPPLAGALLYISQTGNALLGGAALFAMGLGFGAPLLALGASAGGMLPRAGRWMKSINQVFGVLMLGVAVWFLGRILPGPATLLLWALLFIVSAIFMGALDALERHARWRRIWKGVGLAFLVYGAVLIVGAASGAGDALRPLQPLTRALRGNTAATLPFKVVTTVGELHEELREASRRGKPVMLDFYADWCVTCKEMERDTFPDPRVRDLLREVVLLQADVTASDVAAQELLGAFDLYGPPAILFFDKEAQERRAHRLIGFIPAAEFLTHLRAALNS